MKIVLVCLTKVFVCFMFFNNFSNPFINFLHAAKYCGIIDARAALSSRHDSYLGGSHVPAIINVPPQWTTRVSLTGVNPAQEPVL